MINILKVRSKKGWKQNSNEQFYKTLNVNIKEET